MAASPKTCRFRATIYKVGINRCVDVPSRVGRALGPGKYIPVSGRVESIQFSSRLVPRGGGLYRLFIHSTIWKELKVDCGDDVAISLSLDPTVDRVHLPRELVLAFPRGSTRRTALDAETPATRRRFISWVMAARTSETRTRHIQEFTNMLTEKNQKKSS